MFADMETFKQQVQFEIIKTGILRECSEMHANGMHELHDRHHKVSPNLNS